MKWKMWKETLEQIIITRKDEEFSNQSNTSEELMKVSNARTKLLIKMKNEKMQFDKETLYQVE